MMTDEEKIGLKIHAVFFSIYFFIVISEPLIL